MAIYLEQSDLNERLQQAYGCAGTLGYNTDKEFRYGMKCANKHLEDLFLLHVFIDILECYTPLDPDDPDTTQNCISEEQAQYLFEQISRICNNKLDTINTTY